jgi:hypothetical protein
MISVTVTGNADAFRRRAEALADTALSAAAEAAYEFAQEVMEDSKANYCPVDTGRLRDSGFVERPMVARMGNGGGFAIQMGYRAEYAVYVHEIPARHLHGSWKYLSIPFRKHAGRYADRVRAAWFRYKGR